MRLTDGVVTLRRHEAGDLDGLVVMGRDPRTARWTTVPQPFGPDDARGWITEHAPAGWRAGTAFRWAVEARDDDGRPRFAGNLDVRGGDVRGAPGRPRARPAGRGAGPRRRARAPRRDAGGLGRHRLQISTAWTNTASQRLAERAGFVLAARFRQDGVLGDGGLGDGGLSDGGLSDTARYERLAGGPAGRAG